MVVERTMQPHMLIIIQLFLDTDIQGIMMLDALIGILAQKLILKRPMVPLVDLIFITLEQLLRRSTLEGSTPKEIRVDILGPVARESSLFADSAG